MIRAMIWKEWRENRWKYVTLWVVFNLPMLILALSLAFSRGARAVRRPERPHLHAVSPAAAV